MRRGSVMRHTATVSLYTGLSRLLGLVREIVMAALFGTSLAQSAFVVAFRVPNLFRRLFGEGALSAAFVPVFTESLTREGRERAWELAGRVMTFMGVVLCAITVVAIAAMSAVLGAASLGEKAVLVLSLLRIMLPYMVCMCLMALFMAALNSFRHFTVPAASPILLNVIWIGALLWLCPRFGDTPERRIYGVAWGILAAGAIQLAVQIPMLVRYGFRGRLSFHWSDPRVRQVLLLMGPASVGLGLTQINVMVDAVMAMWIGDWAPAALSYAERLIYLPLGMFATALGTVLLPTFSRQAARVDHAEIKRTMNRSLRGLLVVMVPAAVGLIALAPQVVALTYERGAFDAWSTVLTCRAVRFYAPGLVAFSLYKVQAPAFYALQDTKTPVRIGMWAVALDLVLNVVFVLTWPRYYKHAGLAASTVVAAVANSLALGWMLHRRLGSPGWAQIARTAGVTTLCAAVMGAASVGVHRVLAAHVSGLAALGGAIAAGVAVYTALVCLACGRERRELLEAFRERRGVSGPDDEWDEL